MEIKKHFSSFAYAIVAILLLLTIWQSIIVLFEPYDFLLPTPAAVWQVFLDQPGFLTKHALITLFEMAGGLALGAVAGVLTALFLARFFWAEKLFMPFVITTQTLPVFAIAPLLVIWLGLDAESKITMAALIIYFPIVSNFHDGLKNTPTDWLDLAKSWGASETQIMFYFAIPAALPSLVSGLKLAATIAPIGAVVGEWAGAAGGLGYVMLQANARTQTDVVFAALIVLALSAWGFRSLIIMLTRPLVFWQHHGKPA